MESINWVWPKTDANITFLSLSDPLCDNATCLEFYTAYKRSQAQISWASQFEYGKWVSYFYCILIFLFMVRHVYDRINSKRKRQQTPAPNVKHRLLAAFRYCTYRRLPGRIGDSLDLPTLGISFLLLISVLFALLLCFAQRPYYRDRRGYGAPPLGVRTGMAGIALTPLTVALSGKYNLITLLTGISHEKLNVLHRWTGYIYLFFGIAHTIPFLVAALADGGAERLWYQFYSQGMMGASE